MNVSSLPAAPLACCEDEKWAPVPDWPHQASTCGRVRSIHRIDGQGRLRLGGEVAPYEDRRKGKGYAYATLTDGKRRRNAHVAVLVLEAHVGLKPGPGYEACHGNGVRTCNHLWNLRWDTHLANVAEAAEHRRLRSVTTTARDLSQEGLCCHRSHVRRGADTSGHLARASVTRASLPGTGSPSPLSSFPSHFTSVQPFRSLRTLFRQAS